MSIFIETFASKIFANLSQTRKELVSQFGKIDQTHVDNAVIHQLEQYPLAAIAEDYMFYTSYFDYKLSNQLSPHVNPFAVSLELLNLNDANIWNSLIAETPQEYQNHIKELQTATNSFDTYDLSKKIQNTNIPFFAASLMFTGLAVALGSDAYKQVTAGGNEEVSEVIRESLRMPYEIGLRIASQFETPVVNAAESAERIKQVFPAEANTNSTSFWEIIKTYRETHQIQRHLLTTILSRLLGMGDISKRIYKNALTRKIGSRVVHCPAHDITYKLAIAYGRILSSNDYAQKLEQRLLDLDIY